MPNSIHIGFLLLDTMLMTSTTLPMEMLKAAELSARAKFGRDARKIIIETLAESNKSIKTHTGFTLNPDHPIDFQKVYDLIYIPGLWRNPRPVLTHSTQTLEWLTHQYTHGAIVSAVGTGCCFLAQAGLLNGKAATTHWHYFEQFHRDYPEVNLKRQHFITQAGNLYCAASVNSLADLTIHFIQRFYGTFIATQVERHFSHEIRQSYDSKAYFEEGNSPHPDEVISQIQIYLQDNLQKDICMKEIAMRFGLSVRSLNRRFKQATGKTPLEYLLERRLNTAKDLLQNTNLNIGEIADRIGIQDAGYFSTKFKSQLGTTPAGYRKTVRKKLFKIEK